MVNINLWPIYPRGKGLPRQSNRRLVGPHNGSGFGEGKTLLSLLGLNEFLKKYISVL